MRASQLIVEAQSAQTPAVEGLKSEGYIYYRTSDKRALPLKNQDLIIKCKERSYYIHWAVASQQCMHFRLIQMGSASPPQTLDLKDTNPVIVHSLINFLYHGIYDVPTARCDTRHHIEMAANAQMFQCKGLYEHAIEQVKRLAFNDPANEHTTNFPCLWGATYVYNLPAQWDELDELRDLLDLALAFNTESYIQHYSIDRQIMSLPPEALQLYNKTIVSRVLGGFCTSCQSAFRVYKPQGWGTVAAIGTYNSTRCSGCNSERTLNEFRKDWFKEVLKGNRKLLDMLS